MVDRGRTNVVSYGQECRQGVYPEPGSKWEIIFNGVGFRRVSLGGEGMRGRDGVVPEKGLTVRSGHAYVYPASLGESTTLH